MINIDWKNTGPAVRRFFINTLFDSTFMLLGIVVGSAFTAKIDPSIVLATMTTSSLALGISTGVSVYEAEDLEQERRIAEIEKGMLKDMDKTLIGKTAKKSVAITALINFLTPLISCAVMILPFLLVKIGFLKIEWASRISVLLAFMMLFVMGAYMGKMGNRNPWLKGARMTVFGLLAFIIGKLLYSLI